MPTPNAIDVLSFGTINSSAHLAIHKPGNT